MSNNMALVEMLKLVPIENRSMFYVHLSEHDKEVIEKSAKQIRECAMFKWEKEAYDEAYSTGYLRGHIDGYFQGRADEFDAYARSGPTTHNEEETS